MDAIRRPRAPQGMDVEGERIMTKTLRTWSIRIAAPALLASAAGAAAQAPAPPGPGAGDAGPLVTVSATAQTSADPDRAVVRLGAVAEASAAVDAQNEINAVMQKVLKALTGRGVSPRSIRTEALSLSPVYSQVRPEAGRAGPEEQRITGYRAVDVVSVVLDDLAKIGDVVDAGVEAGANQLQGVSFELQSASAARAQALTEAVHEARAQADAVAAAMGMRIRAVKSVVAGGYSVRPPAPLANARFALDVATPVQPGQVDVSANVQVTYYLQPR